MSLRSVLISLAAILVSTIAGCSDELPAASGARRDATAARSNKDRYEVTAQDIASYSPLLKAHEQGELRALRIKVDAARNRLWVLGLKHVFIYDILAKQLIRRVALPNGSIAGFVCSPDIALDRSGAAFIASNAESSLWKIDDDDFSLKPIEIALHAGANRDIGFGALTFASDGALYGLTAHEGSLWRIDVASWNATEVELSERLLDTCALSAPPQHGQGGEPRAVTLCAASGKAVRQIVITPEFTRGHVSNEKCPS
jgi:hypothetical protein